ncbi:hypothetical protein [Nesterenkonia pannonica]|uniref:hypothetical protein n=1 Tax=Nesterenkonia pannonica TaxID=1548602 RepID=UPI0021642A3B|nr:hypothetical protein [Nesterenkonia pannonica]
MLKLSSDGAASAEPGSAAEVPAAEPSLLADGKLFGALGASDVSRSAKLLGACALCGATGREQRRCTCGQAAQAGCL